MAHKVIDDLLRLIGKDASSRVRALTALSTALLSGRGEASGVARARHVLDRYRELTPKERLAWLEALAEQFGPDADRLASAIADYQANPTPASVMALHEAAEPRRQELIRRLNLAPNGTLALVRMREDVLTMLPHQPALAALDADLVHLLSSWFNRGFLVLQRIDWTTPAHILEKIIRYEAVHAITSWEDLQRRLAPRDRRCFAFFHPALADEPLIFVEVALTRETPEAIAPLLAEDRAMLDTHRATTAVFYSISNCQHGLKGVSLGNFLIKQVVEELKREIPSLRQFVTLSPAPGFIPWLARERASGALSGILDARELRRLEMLDRPDWHRDPRRLRLLKPPLLACAAQYLLVARNGANKAVDSVARFHLGNGASLERINWLGDTSGKAMRQSAGIMVNYLYDLPHIERNHEAYANRGAAAASSSVRRLLRPQPARGFGQPAGGATLASFASAGGAGS
jgi:malonyl-CoA decarboxylase